jgi:thymidylate synthase ThyX
MIKAEIIADSMNEFGHRITSFLLVFPRIVLAEFNTHRAISRNSASSRAIPFEKMLEKVQKEPFVPIAWQKDHKGMQGTEYFHEASDEVSQLEKSWISARDNAICVAKEMAAVGCTKQVINRLLEPFMMHTVIATGTEWQNFFALRAHDAAEIHIEDLAYKMLNAYNDSTPKKLRAGEWHIPFGDKIEDSRVRQAVNAGLGEGNFDTDWLLNEYQMTYIKIATARCARVSYENFEGTDDYEKDIKLHDRLSSMGHWSPFEHCAMAMSNDDMLVNETQWSGNFKGFIQYRKTFELENLMDERVLIKK